MIDTSLLGVLADNFRLVELSEMAEARSRDLDGVERRAWHQYGECCARLNDWLLHGDLSSAPLALLDSEMESRARDILQRSLDQFSNFIAGTSAENAYVHFVAAYAAMAQLNGERMAHRMVEAVALLKSAADSTEFYELERYLAAAESGAQSRDLIGLRIWSGYEAMQVLADIISRRLNLTTHALGDIARFSLAPREFALP